MRLHHHHRQLKDLRLDDGAVQGVQACHWDRNASQSPLVVVTTDCNRNEVQNSSFDVVAAAVIACRCVEVAIDDELVDDVSDDVDDGADDDRNPAQNHRNLVEDHSARLHLGLVPAVERERELQIPELIAL